MFGSKVKCAKTLVLEFPQRAGNRWRFMGTTYGDDILVLQNIMPACAH